MVDMELYVVGKINPENHKEWTFEGVFDDPGLAEQRCFTELHFVGPVNLNETLPIEDMDWIDSYYPFLVEQWIQHEENCAEDCCECVG